MAMNVQTMCFEFSQLVNGLRKLKHETAGKKREPMPAAVTQMLTAHQADLQALEQRARDLWVELGSQLVAGTMPERPIEADQPVRVVPAFPDHEVAPPPPNYQTTIPE